MDQDQDKKKKAKPAAQLELSAVKPSRLYSRHLMNLRLTGKNFRRNIINNLTFEGGEIVTAELVNPKQIDLSVRIKAYSRFAFGKITLKDPSVEKPLELPLTILPDPVPGMVQIPAGEFIYGDNRTNPEQRENCKEFACAVSEVSCREYMEFLNFIAEQGDHTFCHPDEPGNKSHTPDFFDDVIRHHPSKPVTGIDWYDAWAYASWRGYRLPSRKEWEKAVRGNDGRLYPWGDEPKKSMANTSDSGIATAYVSANSAGISPHGLINGVGNVWEWTDSQIDIPAAAVIKGGSYKTPMTQALAFSGSEVDKLTRRDDIGFRCAADIHPDVLKGLEENWLESEAEKKAAENNIEPAENTPAKAESDDDTTSDENIDSGETIDEDAVKKADPKSTAKTGSDSTLSAKEKKRLERQKNRETKKTGSGKKKKPVKK